MTYVTCPIRRYHPAVVAQKATTMQLLSDGRFTLGLGIASYAVDILLWGELYLRDSRVRSLIAPR